MLRAGSAEGEQDEQHPKDGRIYWQKYIWILHVGNTPASLRCKLPKLCLLEVAFDLHEMSSVVGPFIWEISRGSQGIQEKLVQF